jgi:hypothetical protein
LHSTQGLFSICQPGPVLLVKIGNNGQYNYQYYSQRYRQPTALLAPDGIQLNFSRTIFCLCVVIGCKDDHGSILMQARLDFMSTGNALLFYYTECYPLPDTVSFAYTVF